MGNKLLATPSLAVTEFSGDALRDIINDMHDTMQAKGGVGIAAPQIGCNLRIIMFGFEFSTRYPNEKPVPLTVLINPVIETLSEKMIEDWEGCLSIPGLRGLVPRYENIRYKGFDLEGKPIDRVVDGFHARVVQHECDHIDGVLFPHRMKDLTSFGFEDELKL